MKRFCKLNFDVHEIEMIPRYVFLFSCLRAVRTLQKFGHLPSDPTVFRSYAQHGVFRDIRLVAIDSLVDFIKSKYSLVYMCTLNVTIGSG